VGSEKRGSGFGQNELRTDRRYAAEYCWPDHSARLLKLFTPLLTGTSEVASAMADERKRAACRECREKKLKCEFRPGCANSCERQVRLRNTVIDTLRRSAVTNGGGWEGVLDCIGHARSSNRSERSVKFGVCSNQSSSSANAG
jgi:hypothetical protein